MFKLSVLIENGPAGEQYHIEHGLSLFIDAEDYRLLFDFGASDNYLENAALMGIDLSVADAAVISHGHYDHSGGVGSFMQLNQKAPVYIGAGAYALRYNAANIPLIQGNNKYGENIGITEENKDILIDSQRVRIVDKTIELKNHILVSGPVKRAYPQTNTPFVIREGDSYKHDPIMDELILILVGKEGYYIITGCCHAGIKNTVAYANEILPSKRLLGLIGGFHLIASGEKELAEIAAYLKGLDLEMIVPLHCTGARATDLLQSEFSQQCKVISVGDSLILK